MKNTQRCLVLILSVLLLLSTIPVSVFALESNTVLFAGGDGTFSNPYQVSTPQQLNAVRNDLSAYYIQINDIDMTDWGNWEPIGTYSNAFKGMYDGNGYKIKKLYVNISSDNEVYVGLFGYISCPFIYDYNKENIAVKNLGIVDGTFIAECSGFDVYAGGIVGYIEYGTIANCYTNSKISTSSLAASTYSGGIAGKNEYSVIKNSYNKGEVLAASSSPKNNGGAYAGGISGQNNHRTIESCYNIGMVKAIASSKIQCAYSGGITGSNFYGTVSTCYNSGMVSSSADLSSSSNACGEAGGITGENFTGEIIDCYNTGDVLASSKQYAYAGGIASSNDYIAKIVNCYNLGIVSAESTYDYDTAGGITASSYSYITNDGIKSDEVKNCYYLNIIEKGVGDGIDTAIKCTSEQMQNQVTFVDFDFETVWTFRTDSGYLYPILQSITNNSGAVVPGNTIKQWYFEEPIVIIDIGETKALSVHSRDVANVNGELVYSNDKVVNASDIDWNAELYEDSGIIKIDDNGQITGLSEGYEHISINSKNDLNLSTFCHVYVGDPNALHYTSTYDTKQYYADGGFYSEVSSISDCVEIYILLENKLKEAVANISRIDETIAKDIEKLTFKDIKPITLTASVNGTGLSFDRDTYTNTHTVTLDAISLSQAVDDILMLFPHNLNVASSGNNYTVTVSLESESFETITDEYSFTIENLETKSANEHIDFISSNKDYKISKQNIYSETMATLKNDAEYKWSKYSTLDFDNYYKVVFADILIQLTNTSQLGHVSLLPVIKEWVGNYKTILSEVTTIVEDDYTGYLNVTENSIDKLLKKSKYETEGMDVNDELRDFVVLKLRDKVSIDKVNSAFAKIDKTQQYISYFELSVDITNDIADFIDGVSVLNAYKDMDDEFKAVIQNLYNQIPSSEKKLKDAVYHYVNVDSYLGYSSEILNEVRDMAGDITLDVFNTLFKKQVVSSICNAIGNITLKSGALLSSTTAFSTISTGLGAVATGATLGICISDILCDNSGKAAEMSKVVAMSEFAQYIINTLNHYESKLYNDRNDNAVSLFEYAFALHKATQGYIMQHTVNSLETKSDSLIIKLFSRDDYDGLITDILAQKRTMDNLQCHNTNLSSTVASNTKVIAIKCPVNVFVCDESGKEVVRIVDNIKEYVADGIDVFVEGGEKYIALPTDQKYSVKIIATDSGTMEYTVTEYGAGTERLRTITKDNIPLINNREFNGQIVKMMDVEPSSYALVYNNTTIFPDDVKIHTLLGDINGDSYIDNLDAAMVLKYDADIIETINVDRSDVNNDGSADSLDAAMILKYDAGIIDSF